MFVKSSQYRAIEKRKASLLTATALVSLVVSSAAYSADVTISSGSTVGQQSVNDDDTLIIENGATINSTTPGVVDAQDGTTITVENEGTITATTFSAVDNLASTLNLTNNGSISGADNGINSQHIDRLSNTSDIVGSNNGIYVTGDTNQFTNSGSITGVSVFGLLGDGTLTSLINSGLMTGGMAAVSFTSIGSITNSGTLSGTLNGIEADDLISLTNDGLITGVNGYGIQVLMDLGTVKNTGTISGAVDGVLTFGKLNSLTNSGLITGVLEAGIDTGDLFGYLYNIGTISGASSGVDAEDLGSVVNTGLITGADGLYSNDSLVSLLNTGTISGNCSCVLGSGVYVYNTAQTIVNTGSITGTDSGIDARDLNTLVNTGTILGENTDGVYVDGGTIGSLINSGSIGGAIHAVDARYITLLANTGSLTGGDDGIFAQSILALANSGSITSTSEDGILAESLGVLVNDGSIAGGDDGIDVQYITNLTNNGSITGQDEGVKAREITLLTNNGTITGGSASDQSGIDSDFGTIVNNGLIQGGIGIEFDRDNSGGSNLGNSKLINNGAIKSTSGASGVAIDFQQTGSDTLTLGANSVIVGSVAWDGVDDTLNLVSNVSNVIKFSNLPDTINNKSNFVVFDGTTLIQVDTTFLASIDDVVGATSNSVNNAVSNQLNDAVFGNSSTQAQAYNSVDGDGIKSVWNSNWFSFNQLDTSNNSSDDVTQSMGSVFGIDITNQSGAKFGAYAGFGISHTKVGATFSHEIDADSFTIGIYSQFETHDLNVGINLQAGQVHFDSARMIANATAASGVETANASYDSFYFAPNLNLTKEIIRKDGFSIIPSLAFGYAGLYVDGYSETGSSVNASIASRTIHQLQMRAKLGARFDWVSDNNVDYIFMPYAGLEGRIASGDIDQVTGTVAGVATTFNPGGDKNTGAAFAGLNINAKLSETARFESAVEAKYDSSNQFAITGSWGVKFKF
ncbi:MAG: autotransporter outer membrane beta-barrel domain-containing protein [Lentilitoribacter sp.]